jgi:hypothetical protein
LQSIFGYVLLGLVFVFTVFGCKKDRFAKESASNTDDLFLTFNASMLEMAAPANLIAPRENHYLSDEVILQRLKEYVDSSFSNASLRSHLIARFGFPVWDKVLIFEDLSTSGTKVILIPMARSDSKFTSAIMPIALDETGGFHASTFIPRFITDQATDSLASCENIQNARMLSTFDYDIFQRLDYFHLFLGSLNCEPEAQDRYNGLTIIVSQWTQGMIDRGRDGGFYWGEPTLQTTYHNFPCEDIIGWGFDFYSAEPYTPTQPSYLSGGGTYNPLGYISKIEHENAILFHNTQVQYNPNYHILNNNYKNCGKKFELGARDLLSEMFRDIFKNNTPINPNQRTEDEIVQILSDGLLLPTTTHYPDLKAAVEASIELLAKNGVYFSLNAALRTIAANSQTLKEDFDKLCLFSEISDSDKAYLANKKEAKADILDFLQNCPYESEQKNTDFIKNFIMLAKTYAISNYEKIDLCNAKAELDRLNSLGIGSYTIEDIGVNSVGMILENHFNSEQELFNKLLTDNPELAKLNQSMVTCPPWMWPILRELAIELVIELVKKQAGKAYNVPENFIDALKAIGQGDLLSFLDNAKDIAANFGVPFKIFDAVWDTGEIGYKVNKLYSKFETIASSLGNDVFEKLFGALNARGRNILNSLDVSEWPLGIRLNGTTVGEFWDDLVKSFGIDPSGVINYTSNNLPAKRFSYGGTQFAYYFSSSGYWTITINGNEFKLRF